MQVCPNCGEENPPKFRLCGYCGTPLAPELPPQEVRKTVSIVFSDLKGSTSLGEALDSEALREVLARYFDEMKAVLELHGGRVEKYIGDAIMAVFGLPRVHEDDAVRAVRAAAGMKEALARLNEELEQRWGVRLENRTGVNTGEVVAGDPTQGQRLVTGDTVNVAARLEQAAPALEVLIGEPTYRLVKGAVDVEPVEPLELKGKSERVPAYRLIAVNSADELGRRRDSPLVGREQELERLLSELELVRTTDATRMVSLLAEAGVGKSRLIEEFARAAGDARVLRGRCLPYGRGITFWPVIEIVRQAAGIDEEDGPDAAYARIAELAGDAGSEVVERVASAVGLSQEQFSLDELFWALRRLFAGLCAERPLVIVFEDIHWAEPALFDLIEYLGQGGGLKALVLCASRPDIAEIRPGWGSKGEHATIELKPLTEEQSELVIANLLGETGIAREVSAKITAAAEGNPLYVEQLLSMLIDDGVLQRQDNHWVPVGDLSDFPIPPTIHALLAARLDLVSREERAVVDPASVIGLVFAEPAVAALVPDAVRPDVAGHLSTLSRRQLIRSERSEAESFRFQHILVRDSAYQALLKRARATYHEQFADWAERVNRERGRETEYEEILGYHLEQAYQYLSELGPLDDRGREIGRRAAGKLSSAGRRAFGRGDMGAASNLLRRGVQLLPEGSLDRLLLLPELAEALTATGEFAWAEVFLDEAAAYATAAGDERLGGRARLVRLMSKLHAGTSDDWTETVLSESREVIPVFERAEDHVGLSKAWRLIMDAHGIGYRFADATEAAERAASHAQLAGDARGLIGALAGRAMAAFYGPTSVVDAIALCEEVLERSTNRRASGFVMGLLAQLRAMKGEFDAARELYVRARGTLEDAGGQILAASASLGAFTIEALAGDPAAAEPELREHYEALGRMGETYVRPTLAACLAWALFTQGRYEEAEELVGVAKDVAAADDVESQALWRSVQARLLVRRGSMEDAIALAGEAVGLLSSTDGLLKQADALMALAEVLSAAGSSEDSERVTLDAVALYEKKGNEAAARAARAALAERSRRPSLSGSS